MIRSTIVVAAGLAFAATLLAAPAQAQTRVFVSAAGNDSNSCINVASPCRHFQQAYAKMPNGGEIDVLDPANYGAITANHTLSIVGRGWATLSPVAGQAAITINAGPSDKIAISGLTLDGANILNTIGIQLNSGASLTVRDSVIQNCTRYGILFQPSASSKVSILNTEVSDNNFGIYIGPTGTGTTNGVLDHVHTDNNVNDAITIIGSQVINATVTDSVIANNGGDGIVVTGPDTAMTVWVRNSTIEYNNSFGLQANGPLAVIALTRSTITGNGTGLDSENNVFKTIISFSDNNILGNSNDGEAPGTSSYK